ncbi:hypothetical protein [Nitrospira sp. Nam80]
MRTIAVVFEGGIKLWNIDGLFYKDSNVRSESLGRLKEVVEKYGIRPIVAILGGIGEYERAMLLPFQEETQSLDIQKSNFEQSALTKGVFFFSQTFNISYLIGAVIYHCKELAFTYNDISSGAYDFPLPGDPSSNEFIFSGHPEPYYEFEALITAARRTYDSTRFILWNTFMGGQGSVPSSFARTIKNCRNIPESLAMRLERSWSSYGEMITEYRDCLQHYCPIGREMPYAHMKRLQGELWSTALWIPDNPQVRSQRLYRYDLKIDALTYGWRVTSELMNLARCIIEELPKKDG